VSDDPLTFFIARSVRGQVSDVHSEIVAKNAAVEIERIHFVQNGEERSLIVKRVPPAQSLEIQLLPFLARKTDRVPEVRSRGIPPAAVPAWPWVLIEDLTDARSACHGDVAAIVRAKIAIERAVVGDQPALKALGVRTVGPLELVERASERVAVDRPLDAEARAAAKALAGLPSVLCHGELVCANARLLDRGVIVVEWRNAYIGCGLVDIARLAWDVESFSGHDPGMGPFAAYGQLTSGIAPSDEIVRAARIVDRAVRGAHK
jgi:hypothetical protein